MRSVFLKSFRKGKCLIFIGIIMLCVLNSCASYRGSVDYSVPLSEQAVLQLPGSLSVIGFNGEAVDWGLVGGAIFGGNLTLMIPEGQHTLIFDYYEMDGFLSAYAASQSGRTGYYTEKSASKLETTGTFVAGNTYKAEIKHSGNLVMVQITEVKKGKPKNSYIGPEHQQVLMLGMTATSVIGFGYAGRNGIVMENITRMAWNVEYGGEVGFAPIGADLFAGTNLEIYFSKKGKYGLGLGGGVVWNISDLYPYARIGVPFVLANGGKIYIYGTYYFTDMSLLGNEWESENSRKWSIGLSWSF